MILAGGRGSRLHELTNKVAKPAVGYGGKYRIVDFPLSNCALMPRTAEFMYFPHVRRLMPVWMYTVEQLMRSLRILISSTHRTRNTF